MRGSTLRARFAFLFLIAGTVGCGQSGTGVPASLTEPSAVSRSATEVRSSPGYDATGPWCFVETDVHGNVDGDPATINMIQDPATGNLSGLTDENGNPIALERLSNGIGAIITYRVFFLTNEGGCDFTVKGTGRLNTNTNTFTMPIHLKGVTCKGSEEGGVIGMKGSCPAH